MKILGVESYLEEHNFVLSTKEIGRGDRGTCDAADLIGHRRSAWRGGRLTSVDESERVLHDNQNVRGWRTANVHHHLHLSRVGEVVPRLECKSGFGGSNAASEEALG